MVGGLSLPLRLLSRIRQVFLLCRGLGAKKTIFLQCKIKAAPRGRGGQGQKKQARGLLCSVKLALQQDRATVRLGKAGSLLQLTVLMGLEGGTAFLVTKKGDDCAKDSLTPRGCSAMLTTLLGPDHFCARGGGGSRPGNMVRCETGSPSHRLLDLATILLASFCSSCSHLRWRKCLLPR